MESLRKHLKKLQEKLRAGNITPEISGMDDVYQPVNLIETYHPPEVDVPDEQAPETPTATQPIYEPEDDVVNRSAIPPANTATKTTTNVTSGNKPKVDPKTGTNGAKTIEDITVKSPQLVEGIGNADLIDAYNAGLNGTDLSRETRANAAAGNYSEQIEAMYNAGQQDSNGSMTDEDQDVSAAEKKSGYQSEVDNLENLGYTAGETTESNSVKVNPTDVTIPNMGAAPNADTAGSGNNTNSGNATSGSNTNNNSTQQYQISDSEKELNYMMDMLFMNGAGSSTDPSVQMAYQWVSNPDNKDKAIPQEVSDAFYAFMGGINDDQIAKSNQIAVGKDDEIGLVWKIYESKPKTTTNPDTNPTAPVSTSLGDYVTSTNQDKQSSYSWGQAGRFALGETLKSNPDIFGERSSVLYEAYQAGLNSIDLTEELVADARAGGFLDEIEAMHQAGETDAKIAKGDVEITEEIPAMGYTQYGQGETAQTTTSTEDSEENSKTGNTSLGEAGNEVLDEIQDLDPTVFFKRYDALIEAYNAGYNGMDLTKEMLSDTLIEKYLEKIYLAGKIDSRTEEGEKELEEWEKLNYSIDLSAWILDIEAKGRTKDHWCWAAAMAMIENFYNNEEEITDTDLVKALTGNTDDQNGYLRSLEPFVHFTLDKAIEGVPTYKTIRDNLKAGQPIVLYTAKEGDSDGSHFIVLVGCYIKDGVEYVVINETRDGVQYDIPYSQLIDVFTTTLNSQVVKKYFTTKKKS